MIGEMVPEGDEYWKNYLDLLTIMDHVFAPTVSLNTVALLHDMIRIHHEQFHKLYPECSIIPKLHYMIHIPEWILKYVIHKCVLLYKCSIYYLTNVQDWTP